MHTLVFTAIRKEFIMATSQAERVQTMAERIRAIAKFDKTNGTVSNSDTLYMDCRPESLSEQQLKDANQYNHDFVSGFAEFAAPQQTDLMIKKKMDTVTSSVPMHGRNSVAITMDRKTGLHVNISEHAVNTKAGTLKGLDQRLRGLLTESMEQDEEQKEKKAA